MSVGCVLVCICVCISAFLSPFISHHLPFPSQYHRMSTISQIISNVKVLKASMSVVPGEEDEELLDDLP